MGTDAPLAVLSDRPQLLYNYFKQLFAQVTNPPIDANLKKLLRRRATTIGPERNLIKPEPESCRQIRLNRRFLSNEELAKLRHIQRDGFKTMSRFRRFSRRAAAGTAGLESAMQDLY
jgi:hypothetical protein